MIVYSCQNAPEMRSYLCVNFTSINVDKYYKLGVTKKEVGELFGRTRIDIFAMWK